MTHETHELHEKNPRIDDREWRMERPGVMSRLPSSGFHPQSFRLFRVVRGRGLEHDSN
jgi:hypothetical protein